MIKIKITKKLVCLLVSGASFILMTACNGINNKTNEVEVKRTFGPGEHILYLNVDISDKRLEYHDGYKIAGICSRSNGPTKAIYVNNEQVECIATKNDYITFGKVVENEKTTESTYILK